MIYLKIAARVHVFGLRQLGFARHRLGEGETVERVAGGRRAAAASDAADHPGHMLNAGLTGLNAWLTGLSAC